LTKLQAEKPSSWFQDSMGFLKCLSKKRNKRTHSSAELTQFHEAATALTLMGIIKVSISHRSLGILSWKAVAAEITLRYPKFYRHSAAHEEKVTWSTQIGTITWRPISQLSIDYLFIKSSSRGFLFFLSFFFK